MPPEAPDEINDIIVCHPSIAAHIRPDVMRRLRAADYAVVSLPEHSPDAITIITDRQPHRVSLANWRVDLGSIPRA